MKIGNGDGKTTLSPSYGVRYSNCWSYTDLSFNGKETDITANANIRIGKYVLNPFASIRIPHEGRPKKKKLGKYFEAQLNVPIWKKIVGLFRYEINNDNEQNFVIGASFGF